MLPKPKVVIKVSLSNVTNCLKFFMFGWKYLTFEVDDSIRPRRARQKEWVNMWKISLYVWVGSQGRVPRCVSVKSWNREIRPVFPWHAFLWFFFFFWSSKSKKVNEWMINKRRGRSALRFHPGIYSFTFALETSLKSIYSGLIVEFTWGWYLKVMDNKTSF